MKRARAQYFFFHFSFICLSPFFNIYEIGFFCLSTLCTTSKISKLIQFSLQFTFFETSKVARWSFYNFFCLFFRCGAPLCSGLIIYRCIMNIAIDLIVKYILSLSFNMKPLSCSIDFVVVFSAQKMISNQSTQKKMFAFLVHQFQWFSRHFLGENYYLSLSLSFHL